MTFLLLMILKTAENSDKVKDEMRVIELKTDNCIIRKATYKKLQWLVGTTHFKFRIDIYQNKFVFITIIDQYFKIAVLNFKTD